VFAIASSRTAATASPRPTPPTAHPPSRAPPPPPPTARTKRLGAPLARSAQKKTAPSPPPRGRPARRRQPPSPAPGPPRPLIRHRPPAPGHQKKREGGGECPPPCNHDGGAGEGGRLNLNRVAGEVAAAESDLDGAVIFALRLRCLCCSRLDFIHHVKQSPCHRIEQTWAKVPSRTHPQYGACPKNETSRFLLFFSAHWPSATARNEM